jgi:hypothetical protein
MPAAWFAHLILFDMIGLLIYAQDMELHIM